ncbi:MAG: ankyrin repeat domain-containing protein [Terriglobia bacterium]
MMLHKIADGRTDLVFDYVAAGNPASATVNGASLMQWCAYYGDVSAIKFLLAKGESLAALGENLDLNGACFHGHWRLCQFLIEQGADVNRALADTGETPLHAALCKTNRVRYTPIVRVLLASGADPNRATLPSAETGGFMRDCRTKGETPLHRAAAFGNEGDIGLLLAAGARIDTKDANGDTPLAWASWYLRPGAVLHLLCYGDFHIHPERQKITTCEPANGSMDRELSGMPHL